MIIIRFFAILFNVTVVGYLIYRMLEVFRVPMQKSKKTFIILGGVILLLAPFGMFFRFFAPTLLYFFVYPIAIGLYLYMIREL